MAEDVTAGQSGRNRQSATTTWAPRRSFPGGTPQHWGLGKLPSGNKQGPRVARDCSCQAFPETFQLDLKSESSPWAFYVTKGRTNSQKRFLCQASGFCLEASKNLGFWIQMLIQTSLLWLSLNTSRDTQLFPSHTPAWTLPFLSPRN